METRDPRGAGRRLPVPAEAPGRRTPFGEAVYAILADRGVPTRRQGLVADVFNRRGFPKERPVTQQDISNWFSYGKGRPKRPPKAFPGWFLGAFSLTEAEARELAYVYLFETEWVDP